jgi:serine/threonine-protein kinase RsbW/sigma-B regulation protein RsbU (phosphoserine phosphatase)
MVSAPGALAPCLDRPLALSVRGVVEGLQAAEDFLAAAGVSTRARDRAALVLEEALMNLVLHGVSVGGVRCASFQVSLQPAAIVLKVRDDGQPFDPRQRPLPEQPASLESATPGGQGLRLMQRFARELHYEQGADGNGLTLLLDR